MRAFILDLRKKQVPVAMFSIDDKAKIPLGRPSLPIGTGVRGRRSIGVIGKVIMFIHCKAGR